MSAVDLDNLHDEQVNQLIRGRAHFRIYVGLWNEIHTNPGTVGGMEVFFGLTLEGHYLAMHMYLSRLLDRPPAQGLRALLQMVEESHPRDAKHMAERLDAISGIERKVRKIRNKLLAHLDKEAIMNRKQLESQGATIGEIRRAYREIASIIHSIALSLRHTSIDTEFPRWDDYEYALSLLESGKQAS